MDELDRRIKKVFADIAAKDARAKAEQEETANRQRQLAQEQQTLRDQFKAKIASAINRAVDLINSKIRDNQIEFSAGPMSPISTMSILESLPIVLRKPTMKEIASFDVALLPGGSVRFMQRGNHFQDQKSDVSDPIRLDRLDADTFAHVLVTFFERNVS